MVQILEKLQKAKHAQKPPDWASHYKIMFPHLVLNRIFPIKTRAICNISSLFLSSILGVHDRSPYSKDLSEQKLPTP